jgi:hypothetical protein
MCEVEGEVKDEGGDKVRVKAKIVTVWGLG